MSVVVGMVFIISVLSLAWGGFSLFASCDRRGHTICERAAGFCGLVLGIKPSHFKIYCKLRPTISSSFSKPGNDVVVTLYSMMPSHKKYSKHKEQFDRTKNTCLHVTYIVPSKIIKLLVSCIHWETEKH